MNMTVAAMMRSNAIRSAQIEKAEVLWDLGRGLFSEFKLGGAEVEAGGFDD